MKRTAFFQRNFPTIDASEKALDRLREKYALRSQPEYTVQRRYFDTFDWRLYRSGFVLEQDDAEAGVYRIRSLGQSGEQFTCALNHEPDFSWNLPHPDLRNFLAPLIGVRRLLVQDTIEVRITPGELLDNRGRILLRFELEKFIRHDRTARPAAGLVNCRFQPAKGQKKACARQLRKMDKVAESGKKIADPFAFILSLHNRTPVDYASKLNLTLAPKMTMGQVLATALLFHIDMIRKNLPGIMADLDTEFLHDLRIANRRSRSLVARMRHVLPPDREMYYMETFSWLSKQTRDHRDLDICLLAIPQYQAMLPVAMRADLEPLGQWLINRRQQAHEALLQVLASDRFKDFLAASEVYFTAGLTDHFQTERGRLPVTDLADKVMWKAYRRLLKQGRIAGRTGNRELLHDLRKTTKKLRYLLETFKSLYPARDMEQVITHSRKLQNLLGRIVDYRVRQRYLLGLSDPSTAQAELPAATTACIQYLVDSYRKLEEEACDKFAGQFADFSNADTKKLFRKLFRQAG